MPSKMLCSAQQKGAQIHQLAECMEAAVMRTDCPVARAAMQALHHTGNVDEASHVKRM